MQKRISLPLRGDQGPLTRYFYERDVWWPGKIKIPHTPGIWIFNIHASAFATDDTKYKHILKLRQEMDNLQTFDIPFVVGGDLILFHLDRIRLIFVWRYMPGRIFP